MIGVVVGLNMGGSAGAIGGGGVASMITLPAGALAGAAAGGAVGYAIAQAICPDTRCTSTPFPSFRRPPRERNCMLIGSDDEDLDRYGYRTCIYRCSGNRLVAITQPAGSPCPPTIPDAGG